MKEFLKELKSVASGPSDSADDFMVKIGIIAYFLIMGSLVLVISGALVYKVFEWLSQ